MIFLIPAKTQKKFYAKNNIATFNKEITKKQPLPFSRGCFIKDIKDTKLFA